MSDITLCAKLLSPSLKSSLFSDGYEKRCHVSTMQAQYVCEPRSASFRCRVFLLLFPRSNFLSLSLRQQSLHHVSQPLCLSCCPLWWDAVYRKDKNSLFEVLLGLRQKSRECRIGLSINLSNVFAECMPKDTERNLSKRS